MKKIIYRPRPGNEWRIDQLEAWFQEQARAGLHLYKIGRWFVQFQRGEPKQTRYGVAILPGKKPDPELKELCSKAGWSYVADFGRLAVFSTPETPEATAFHTDPVERAYSLKPLWGSLWREILLALALVLVGIGAVVFFDINLLSAQDLVEGKATPLLLGALVVAVQLAADGAGIFFLRGLRKALLSGWVPAIPKSWSKQLLKDGMVNLFCLGFGLVAAFLPLFGMLVERTYPLPVEADSRFVIRLQDIEENPEMVRREPGFLGGGIDRGNAYTQSWNLLTARKYYLIESGVAPAASGADSDRTEGFFLYLSQFRLRIPALAVPLTLDLANQEDYRFRGGTEPEEWHVAGLDRLLVREEERTKAVYAARGNLVVEVIYTGNQPLEQVVDRVAKELLAWPEQSR